MRNVVMIVAVAIILVVADSATALDLECMQFRTIDDKLERPSAPTCVDELQRPFDNSLLLEFQSDVDSCRSELDDYRAKVSAYIECLKSESQASAAEFNEVVNKFNCKVSGNC